MRINSLPEKNPVVCWHFRRATWM